MLGSHGTATRRSLHTTTLISMRTSCFLLAAVLATAVALPAAAQLVLGPGELTVSDKPSNGEHQPAVALVRDGSLVAWEEEDRGLAGRRFNASGAARGPSVLLVANDPIPPVPFSDRLRHEAQEVAIAARPDGTFLAVWIDVKVRHSHDGFVEHRLIVSRRVAARFFDAESRPTSRVWMVSGLEGVASRPRVVLQGNRFLLTWQENGGRQPGIHLSTMGRKGLTRDLAIGDRGLRPAIGLGGRGAMVAWVKCCGLQGGYQLLAQRLNGSGVPSGESFVVATDLPRGAEGPAVAGQPGGNFLIAFQRLRESDLSTQIFGQLVSAQGDLVGAEVPLSIDYGTAHTAPVAGALSGGGWVVGWMTWVNGFRVGSTLTALGPLGNALGNPVDLNEGPVAGLEMGLAVDADRRMLAAWEGFDQRGARGLRARAVRAN